MSPTTRTHTPRALWLVALLVAALLPLAAPASAAGGPLRSIHPASLPPLGRASSPDWIAFKGQLFFLASSADGGYGLWKSAGTPETTTLVKSLSSHYSGFIEALGDTLLFQETLDDGSIQLWRSDGTAAGTAPLSAPLKLARWHVFGASLLFLSTSGGAAELWLTDGSEAGTARVKTIYPAGSGMDQMIRPMLTVVGGVAYFEVSSNSRLELWRSDGTAAGTTMVRAFQPGSASLGKLLADGTLGDVLIFSNAVTDTLWRTDGTAAGTFVLTSGTLAANSGAVALGGALYLAAYTDAYQIELWRTDGTVAGTWLVKDINPGTGTNGGSWPDNLTIYNGKLYFTVCDKNWPYGRGSSFNDTMAGLWVSDGTAAGTQLVTKAGRFSDCHDSLWATGRTLIYQDYLKQYAGDGTAAGMRALMPPVAGAEVSSSFDALIGEALFFSVNYRDAINDPVGFELWRTNGSQQGTSLLQSPFFLRDALIVGDHAYIYGGALPSDPRQIYAAPLADLLAVRGQVTAATGGTVTSLDGQTTVNFPAGAVAGDVTVTLRPLGAPSAATGGQTAARSFSLEARDAGGKPVTGFPKPLTLTVRYRDDEVAGLYEPGLSLAYWDGAAWKPLLPCVGCVHDMAANTVTAKLDHLTEFALLGQDVSLTYLPGVAR